MRKLISIVTPCYNEEANIDELHQRIVEVAVAAGAGSPVRPLRSPAHEPPAP